MLFANRRLLDSTACCVGTVGTSAEQVSRGRRDCDSGTHEAAVTCRFGRGRRGDGELLVTELVPDLTPDWRRDLESATQPPSSWYPHRRPALPARSRKITGGEDRRESTLPGWGMVGGRWLHAVRVSGSWNHQVAPRAVRASSQIVGGLGATVGQTRGSAVALWGWVGVGEAAKRWRCRMRGRGAGGCSPTRVWALQQPAVACGGGPRRGLRPGFGSGMTIHMYWAALSGEGTQGQATVGAIREFGGPCGHTSAAPPPHASPTRNRAPQQPATYSLPHVYVCGARPGPGRRGVGGPSAEHATCHQLFPTPC